MSDNLFLKIAKSNWILSNDLAFAILDGYPVSSGHTLVVAKVRTSLHLSSGYPSSKLWDHLSDRMVGARLVDILASFVQQSGLEVIEQRLFRAVKDDAALRILVSDYLYISEPKALWRLLAWQELIGKDADCRGSLSVKLVQCGNLASKPASFHPKAWRIVDQSGAFIAVGSSNLSRPALETGIEWNLLYSSQDHFGVPDDFAREFDLLWHASADLTSQLVQQYEAASRDFRQRHFEPESIDDPIIPEPRPWQLVALESLRRIRKSGYTRALVAVATGMGKTWLAAFDVRQLGQLMGRRPGSITLWRGLRKLEAYRDAYIAFGSA